jgi:hypothetical protein
MSGKPAFSKEDTALQERALKELGVERILRRKPVTKQSKKWSAPDMSAIRAASKTVCFDSFILKQVLKQMRSICLSAFQSAMIAPLRLVVIFAG